MTDAGKFAYSFVWATLIAGRLACGQETTPPPNSKSQVSAADLATAQAAYDLMAATCDQLVSGHYVATGTATTPLGTNEFKVDGLFDRSQEAFSQWVTLESERLIITTPEMYLKSSQNVQLKPPADLSTLKDHERPLFRPWAMSLLPEDFMDVEPKVVLEILSSVDKYNHLVAVQPVDQGIKLTWYQDHKMGSTVRVMVIDTEHGVPLSNTFGRSRPGADPPEVGRPYFQCSTVWETLNGVIVPISWKYTLRHSSDLQLRASYELEFEWSDINVPVAPERFTWQGAGIRDGKKVYDYRLGERLLVGTTGMNKPVKELFANDPQGAPYLVDDRKIPVGQKTGVTNTKNASNSGVETDKQQAQSIVPRSVAIVVCLVAVTLGALFVVIRAKATK